jgi:2,3-bisphosphoglycerate-dependent phosphoglycerate mutase
MTILIVARHGNTFESGEPPRRVGARTDMNLTQKGLQQGKALGDHFKAQNILPQHIFTSRLKRTIQTAQEIIQACGANAIPQQSDIFNEIDYGPDENQTEDTVIARIGEAALQDWENHAILPPGWSPDSKTIVQNWQDFAARMAADCPDDTVLVVTSNGIARFALELAGNGRDFDLKLATGAYGILEHTSNAGWIVKNWNTRP